MRAMTYGTTGRRLAAATTVAVFLTALLLALLGPVGAAQEAPQATPGSVVVTETDAGRLSVVDSSGRSSLVADGLKKPNGVAALGDGTILIADTGASRLAGINGRYGRSLTEIAKLDFPVGVAVGLDGAVYVTLTLKGEVGKVDLSTGEYTKIAGDLKGPADLAVRSGLLYVAEGATGAGDVVEVTLDGNKRVVATGFQQPTGVATGPGSVLFVADYLGNKIVKIGDDGARTDFATTERPVQLATEPYRPVGDEPFAVVATAGNSLVKFDQTGKPTMTLPLEKALGVATVPPPDSPNAASGPGVASGPSGGPADGNGDTATTQRLTRSRATIPIELEAGLTTSNKVLILCFAIIAMVVIAIVLFALQRKGKGSAEAGFEERPLDAHSVSAAFGPCAPEEVELAEAEGALRSIITQREAAERRVTEGEARVHSARRRQMQALRQVERERGRRRMEPAYEALPPPPPPPVRALRGRDLRVGDLALATDAGRAALVAFVRGEIGAQTLEELWLELGELQAIDVVRLMGKQRAEANHENHNNHRPPPPMSKAERAELRAREDIELATADWAHANQEIERLKERELASLDRIATARRSLNDCQDAHMHH